LPTITKQNSKGTTYITQLLPKLKKTFQPN